jgi:hypothetical protein
MPRERKIPSRVLEAADLRRIRRPIVDFGHTTLPESSAPRRSCGIRGECPHTRTGSERPTRVILDLEDKDRIDAPPLFRPLRLTGGPTRLGVSPPFHLRLSDDYFRFSSPQYRFLLSLWYPQPFQHPQLCR